MVFRKADKKYHFLKNAVTNKNDQKEICAKEKFRKNIRLERERADRSHHQFSLIVFDLNTFDISQTKYEHICC